MILSTILLLEMYVQAVNLEDAADAGLAYLVRVEQLELLGALIEVIAKRDAVAPALITFLQAVAPKTEQVSRAEKEAFSLSFLRKTDVF